LSSKKAIDLAGLKFEYSVILNTSGYNSFIFRSSWIQTYKSPPWQFEQGPRSIRGTINILCWTMTKNDKPHFLIQFLCVLF
jgi:hypothetical protein